MASVTNLFAANPQRNANRAARVRMLLSAVVVLALLFSISGVLTSPAPAQATESGLGSAPSSPSESPRQNEETSGSELQNGDNTPRTEPESTRSPTAEQSAPSSMPSVPAQAMIACAPGNVYSITSAGQLRHVTPDGTATNVGTVPSGAITQFNGLGIGTGGGPVYAYDRTNSTTATFYQFNTATDTWSSLGLTYNTALTANGGFNGSLVAGAVDLKTGAYFFGGFVSGAQQFKLWRYNPSARTVTFMGTVNTPGAGTSANGDIAFDSAGNLFIVRNENRTATEVETKIFSVTDVALAAANGGAIPAAAGSSMRTVARVTGVAFDSTGKGYLGAGDVITSYDTPGWNNPSTFTNQLTGTSDLASCSSPATITLEKDVKTRVNPGDQFNLELNQGTVSLGTATTTGTANGVQSERVGPLPVARNATIRLSETAAGTTDLSRYASSYSCTADGNPIGISGTGTSAAITIPATGNEIVCQFSNSPLTANVTINKKTQNAQGGNEQNASGWTVGAATTATAGTATQAPAATTQQTDAQGNAKWTLNFGSASSRANLAVREVQRSGFAFQGGSCRITRLDGTTQTITLNGADSQTLSSAIQPGDQVDCGYVNRQSNASVTVNKAWDIDSERFANGSQPAGISATLMLDPAGQPAGDPEFGQTRTGFAVNDTVRIGETTTIDAQKFPGCTLKSKTISGPGIDGTVPLTDDFSTKLPGAANTYTVTNTVECQTLTITKNVENDNGGTLTAADWNQRLFAKQGTNPAVPYDSGEKKYVTTGSYVISENSLPGYEQVSIRCTGATYDESTKTVTIAAGQNAQCIVANADSSGTVSWEKVNESGAPLEGSEWTISDAAGNEIPLDDCVATSAEGCSGRDVDPEAGQFRVEYLDWGDYTLVETKAPAGYVLDETPRPFTISRDRLDFAFEEPIANEQASSPELPFTGGIGTTGYIIGGVVLLLGGAAGAIWQYRRRAHGRS